jgi:hypothetical protein
MEDKSDAEVVINEQEIIAKVKVVTKPIISQKPTKRLRTLFISLFF